MDVSTQGQQKNSGRLDVDASLRSWLRSFEPRALLLLVGFTGSGLSTLVYAALHDLAIEHVTFGPGTTRLKHSMSDAAGSCISATGRRKVVVVDGFEAIMADANTAADISAFVKKMLPAPVVCIAHRTRTIVARFRDLFSAANRNRATVLEFPPPSVDEIAAIIRNRHAHIDQPTATSAAVHSNGDIRAALASLEIKLGHKKDAVCESFQVVDDILDGAEGFDSIAEVLRVVAEPSVVSCGIFERYGFSLPCIEALSDADVIDAYMYRYQRFDLHEFYTTQAVAAPAVHIRRGPGTPLPKSKACKFLYGVVWSKSHLHAARAKLAALVMHQRALSGLSRVPIHELAYLRDMVLHADEQRDGVKLASLCHGLEPDGILALMRLFKIVYTQGTHARVCRLIKKQTCLPAQPP